MSNEELLGRLIALEEAMKLVLDEIIDDQAKRERILGLIQQAYRQPSAEVGSGQMEVGNGRRHGLQKWARMFGGPATTGDPKAPRRGSAG